MKKEIYDILSLMLGENATAIITDEDAIEYGGDGIFYSQFDEAGIPAFEIQTTESCKVDAGCSRLVLIPKDKDYVIKLPIMIVGSITYDVRVKKEFWIDEFPNAREDNEYYYINGLSEIEFYEYSGFEKLAKHFTITRRQQTDLMDEENAYFDDEPILHKVLLDNEYEGDFNGIPVYTQKKATAWRDTARSAIESAEKDVVRVVRAESFCRSFPDEWISACIKNFGQADTISILAAMASMGIDVDMNANNFGFRNDVPCVFDYGSYYESEVWSFNMKGV